MIADKFKWSGINWRVGHPWGVHHPNHPLSWYGNDSVRIDRFGYLYLNIQKEKYNYKGNIVPYNVGLVSSIDTFSYGVYEIEALLPRTPYCWASIWTCSAHGDWLHEIDICEAESDENGNYNTELFKGKPFRSMITTNVHYKDMFKEHKQLGMKGICKTKFYKGRKIDEFNYCKYKLVYVTNCIEIYVNDCLVRRITNKNALAAFNASPEFYFIINQEVNQYKFEDKYLNGVEPFVIKSVKEIL